ncbi:MAG: FecR domain-containing protein, partial [Methylomonas sp.]|nr:FecR domain-containing protein [Methylomonas sp.]
MNIDPKPDRTYRRLLRAMIYWLGVISLFMLNPVTAGQGEAPSGVGQVTLVIGQAQAIAADGKERSLGRSDWVYAGETIQTQAGGHVHLRFIDDGTLSLRPNSRLLIELYHYDQQQPKNSAIRLSLQVGVVRSISGKATEAAHERFRLNTPITAIGVLGTDFVVRAEAEKMWAGVYSGAIAIAPLTEHCMADGLGACAGATHLSETMGSVMLELNGRRAKEKIVPLDPAILSKSRDNEAPGRADAASGRITVEEMKVVEVSERLQESPPQTPPDSPSVPIVEPLPSPSPFAWGRWGSQRPGDDMTQTIAEA